MTTTSAKTSHIPLISLVQISVLAAVAAAAATEALTAIVRAVGVDLAVGEPGGSAASVVPVELGDCTMSVAFASVIGMVIAACINRWAAHPARVYRTTMFVLAVASFAAPLSAGATSSATKVTLVAAHTLAAAIIVTLVGGRLERGERLPVEPATAES